MLERDQHAVQQLKAQSATEFEHYSTTNRLFESMMKNGGPGAVGVSERPFYHPADYVWKYFCELAAAMEKKFAKYRAMVDELDRQFKRSDSPSSSSPQGASLIKRLISKSFWRLRKTIMMRLLR